MNKYALIQVVLLIGIIINMSLWVRPKNNNKEPIVQGDIYKAAVWTKALTKEQIESMSDKDEILAGFAALTIVTGMGLKEGEEAWTTIDLQGKHKVVFRYGDVGFDNDKILKGMIIDFVKIKAAVTGTPYWIQGQNDKIHVPE